MFLSNSDFSVHKSTNFIGTKKKNVGTKKIYLNGYFYLCGSNIPEFLTSE